MKKMRIFMFLVLSLLLVNCGKEEKKVEESNVGKTEVVATNNENKEEDINVKLSDETYKDLEIFIKNKEEIVKKLDGITKEEADELLDKYMKENRELIFKIDKNENDFLEENGDYYSEEKIKEIEKFFNKYGLKIQETGGGYELDVPSSFYYSIFKDYISDEYRDYLELTSKYNDKYTHFMPNNLNIQETGERIVAFEKFIDKYPYTRFYTLSAIDILYHIKMVHQKIIIKYLKKI